MRKLKDAINIIRYDIPQAIRNIWIFFRVIVSFRNWDHFPTLDILQKCLIELEKGQKNEFSGKSAPKIRRCIEIIDLLRNSDFTEESEKRTGKKLIYRDFKFEKTENGHYQLIDDLTPQEKNDNMKIFQNEHEIEHELWEELFDILRGNYSKHTHLSDPNLKNKSHEDVYDGTGMMNWWV